MNKPAQAPSIEEALSSAALKHLSEMSTADFVKQLQARGIHSLEDLATNSIATAKRAVSSGLTFVDPSDFGVCYKFTTNPHRLGENELGSIVRAADAAFKQ
jgi:hypothetical protein